MAQHGKREQTSNRRESHPLRTIFIIVTLVALIAVGVVWLNSRGVLRLPVLGVSSQETSTSVPSDESTSIEDNNSEIPLPEQVSSSLPTEEELLTPEDSQEEDATPAAPTIDLLMLVNKTHELPSSDSPELTELSNGQTIATVIYPDLQKMFNDMRAQDVYPVVASGYRTPEKQKSLMDEKIASLIESGSTQEEAEAEAAMWVNPVGYSEHQTGLAVDINADGVHSTGDQVYGWLAEHAWEYGFILRYPEGKSDITGTDYEPWHYRYVGIDNAKAIFESNLTLEEYLS